MDLNALVDTFAREADEYLQGIHSRTEARVAIIDRLATRHPEVPERARKTVVDGVMTILEDEDFFEFARSESLDEGSDEPEE